MSQVTIDQGTLQGSLGSDSQGNKFEKFQGIPYAKPPLGDLRFKAPQPPEKWTGVWDATHERDCCYNKDLLIGGVLAGSENCLFLNVFTKNCTAKKPVMVWIHGGGFLFGSGNEAMYGPEFLMTQDIVLVTLNYRLGLLGFLSFDDESLEIPGNAGMKDQVMALKWVQKNIAKFGGDPDNVTIFGESAGGASVHLLVLSPLAKGLFHRAIAQSGCAINPWVTGGNGAKHIANILGIDGADERKIYEMLQKMTVEDIFKIQEKTPKLQERPTGIVVEKNPKGAFLAEKPLKLMENGSFNQVPFMIGYTTLEGLIMEIFKKEDGEANSPSIEDMIPGYFGYKKGTPESKKIAEKIQAFYFSDPEKLLANTFQFSSDSQFIYGIFKTVLTQYVSSQAPTYLYRMSIETELNFFKKLMKVDLPGVSHLDDVGYLFKHLTTPEIKPNSIEDKAQQRFLKLWTNFAKYGNPTPDASLGVVWKPVTGPNIDFLDIGEELEALDQPDKERMEFWQKLFRESPTGSSIS